MPSDKARRSYDERRQWRSVVRQQGRVTLEADQNEADEIAAEELRKATLDVVGRTGGTPNGSYLVQVMAPSKTNPAGEIVVGQGTMYVNGVRAFSFAPIQYSNQPDWLHPEDDPFWKDPTKPADPQLPNELVYLMLVEQEVGAVEDTALREVALGGPDTCQRTRLLQRIVRFGTGATDCNSAKAELMTALSSQGLSLQGEELLSDSVLQVSFSPNGGKQDVCEPEATGGFLKPDNQLIRVQVASAKAENLGDGALVWGYDSASFQYRASVVNSTTLKLKSRPIDDLHRPLRQQIVEVLHTTARLETGSHQREGTTSPEDYVAAPTGFVVALDKDYDPDTGEISLSTALPGNFFPDPADLHPPPLFVRVWQGEETVTQGVAHLGDTGIAVTITNVNKGPLHPGDFWLLATRPTTPNQVYPQRYLDQPQPRDGPRVWVCPLAIVHWANGVLQQPPIAECRNLFEDLVKLTKKQIECCCTVRVRPEEITVDNSLQSILDRFRGQKASICLFPGEYRLPAPLMLDANHNGTTIESCRPGVRILADTSQLAKFDQGLIILNAAADITLRGLELDLPQVRYNNTTGNVFFDHINVSYGIRPIGCERLMVDGCRFRFSEPSGNDAGRQMYAIGIFAGAREVGVTVQDSVFDGPPIAPPFATLYGYVLPGIGGPSGFGFPPPPDGIVGSTLDDVSFLKNAFSGLTTAVLVNFVECGRVRIEDNQVRNCRSGFSINDLRATSAAPLFRRGTLTVPEGGEAIVETLARLSDDDAMLTSLFLQTYPLPEGADVSSAWRPTEMISEQHGQRAIASFVNGMVGGVGQVAQASAQPAVVGRAVSRVEAAYSALAAVERAVLLTSPSQLRLSISVINNDVESDSFGGLEVFHVADPAYRPGEVVINSNRFRDADAESGGSGVTISGVGSCIVTGNQVLNSGRASLTILLPMNGSKAQELAVTGNIFCGPVHLPDRPSGITVPWEWLNTQACPPHITLSKSDALHPGDQIEVTGTGFDPSRQYVIRFETPVVGGTASSILQHDTQTPANGGFVTTVKIPPVLLSGPGTIVACMISPVAAPGPCAFAAITIISP